VTFEERVHRKVDELLHAVQKGLSSYAGPLRVAVVMRPYVYDPYGLLKNHAADIKAKATEIDGLVCYQHGTQAIWYAELPPDLCHPESIRLWLLEAARCLSAELALGVRSEVHSSRITLENYSLYAIERFIANEYEIRRRQPPQLQVMEILETLAAISLEREESTPTTGEILFADTMEGQPLQLTFDPRPSMTDRKHLAKLFHGLWKGVSLISCGREVWGIGRREELRLELLLRAEFQSGIGGLYLGGELCGHDLELCTISAGRLQARRINPQLPGLMRTLKRCGFTNEETRSLDRNLSILCSEINRLHHGATVVLETGSTPLTLSGQAVMPTRLDIQALRALSEVDGALHLDREGRLKGFGCLLDGMASAREDRARGARYNSALRFTETHEDCLVIVISADGPISVFRKGVRLGSGAAIKLRDAIDLNPPTLEDWLSKT
jgi:hypothetical protein